MNAGLQKQLKLPVLTRFETTVIARNEAICFKNESMLQFDETTVIARNEATVIARYEAICFMNQIMLHIVKTSVIARNEAICCKNGSMLQIDETTVIARNEAIGFINADASKQTSDQLKRTMQRGGSVYIMTNVHHQVLYTGVTSDLIKRVTGA